MKTLGEVQTRKYCRPGNRGFVMILALMVLLIVSLLGSLSLKVSNTEVITSGALEGSVASFYLVESLGRLAIENLEQQNVAGDDCAEEIVERCRVKELYQADSTGLPWLDVAWMKDGSRDIFDLRVMDPTIEVDTAVVPQVAPFPDNWHGSGRKTARVPEPLRAGSPTSLEPSEYRDFDEGGRDLIRYAVRDHGRIGVYSIGAGDPVIREYKIYGLYFVGADNTRGYPGKYGIEMGYRLELARMEIM